MLGKMRLSKMNVEYLLVSVGAPSALQCQIHMCLEWTKLVYNKERVQMHIATTVSFFNKGKPSSEGFVLASFGPKGTQMSDFLVP